MNGCCTKYRRSTPSYSGDMRYAYSDPPWRATSSVLHKPLLLGLYFSVTEKPPHSRAFPCGPKPLKTEFNSASDFPTAAKLQRLRPNQQQPELPANQKPPFLRQPENKGGFSLLCLSSYILYFAGRRSSINSSNCFWSTAEGASNITSRPELFFGKAIQSRMLSSPAKRLTQRSKP